MIQKLYSSLFFLVRWNSTKNKENKEFFREKLILIQIGYRAFAKHNKKNQTVFLLYFHRSSVPLWKERLKFQSSAYFL